MTSGGQIQEQVMSTDPEVDRFLADLDHPLKDEMQAVRKIILEADDRMTETIKWGGPTFMYKGNMATINPRAKKFVNLFFQTGSVIENRHGVLEGDAAQVRTIKFTDMDDVDGKKDALTAVVKDWIEARDSA